MTRAWLDQLHQLIGDTDDRVPLVERWGAIRGPLAASRAKHRYREEQPEPVRDQAT